MFDSGTRRHLDTVGIDAGMRCLEVGGGGGSIARWMAERVGPAGSVLVTDIDVSGLVGCDRPNIEVRLHDVCTDALDEDRFDVIHARLVLEHLPSRLDVLAKLVAALRPGGRVLIEDFDFSEWIHAPQERLLGEPEQARVTLKRALVAVVSMGGPWDAEFGRKLPLHLVNAGLEDVGAEACTPLVVGGSLEAAYHKLSLRQLGHLLVGAGSFSQEELDEQIAAFENPGSMISYYTMVSAWGRRAS